MANIRTPLRHIVKDLSFGGRANQTVPVGLPRRIPNIRLQVVLLMLCLAATAGNANSAGLDSTVQRKLEEVILRLASPETERIPIGLELLRHLGVLTPAGKCLVSSSRPKSFVDPYDDLSCPNSSLSADYKEREVGRISEGSHIKVELSIQPNSLDLGRFIKIFENLSWGVMSNLDQFGGGVIKACKEQGFVFVAAYSDNRKHIPPGTVYRSIYLRNWLASGEATCPVIQTDLQIIVQLWP
jgi:hypothetical protein